MNSLEEISLKVAQEIPGFVWCEGSMYEDGVLEHQVKEFAHRLVAALGAQEPVAWLFQHDETCRTMCVDSWQVENGFEAMNPRLQKIHPLFAAPVLPSVPEFTDFDLTRIYNEANGIGEGKSPPITTQRIFAAMRAMTTAAPSPQEDAK